MPIQAERRHRLDVDQDYGAVASVAPGGDQSRREKTEALKDYIAELKEGTSRR